MTDFKEQPVLVTGAEGFIGSRLAERLVGEGARVAALVHPRASRDRLRPIGKAIRIVPLDIREGAELAGLVAEIKPRKIFHLAAMTNLGRSWENLTSALEVNLGGTVNLLQALSRIEYEILISTCTSEVYGSNPPPFREDMPLDPVSPYSFSKAAATILLRMSTRSLGARACVLRLFLAYGPGQGEERFLPQLIRAGLSGQPFSMTAGEQTREYTYIDDVVEGFLRAAARGDPGGEVYNLGSGEEISLRGLVAKVQKLLGREIRLAPDPLPYRENEMFKNVGDHGKARQALGWRATVPLDAGLARTIDSYR